MTLPEFRARAAAIKMVGKREAMLTDERYRGFSQDPLNFFHTTAHESEREAIWAASERVIEMIARIGRKE